MELKEIRTIARCGYCKNKMDQSIEPGLILLDAFVTWDPSWSLSQFSPTKGLGILCDDCLLNRKYPLESIEILKNKTIVYHEIEIKDDRKDVKSSKESVNNM